MFYVFEITINCQKGYATIVDERIAKRFHENCRKERFISKDIQECKRYIDDNCLKYDPYIEIEPVNNDLWHND